MEMILFLFNDSFKIFSKLLKWLAFILLWDKYLRVLFAKKNDYKSAFSLSLSPSCLLPLPIYVWNWFCM